MNTILRKITNEMYNSDLSQFYRKVGNYKVIRTKLNIYHYYFNHLICKVDLIKNEFILHDCGYKNYRLTTAQLNFLEDFYKNKGYKFLYRGI